MGLPWLEGPWKGFLERIRQDRLPHGILVCGPAGIGKLQLARDMAARLLCLQPDNGACGTCRSCALLVGGAHPDCMEIRPEEGKHQIRVAQVRRLGEALALTTTISPCKLAIIEPAEAMNINAANALLKNLEEPPGETVMILVSHDAGRLPVTVRSRCQPISVTTPASALAVSWLMQRTGLDETRAQLALEAGSGSPLAALELADDGRVGEFSEVRDRLRQLLGRPRAVTPCVSGLSEIDAGLLWRWLSLSAASAARVCVGHDAPEWLGLAPGLRPDGKVMVRLQLRADHNRALARTPVRQDLLLQEWLLEWAGQPLARVGQDN